MPDEENKMVPIDTSGPDAEVDIEEEKDESVVETEAPKQETENTEQEKTKQELETGGEVEKKDDEKLEEYSKGVQKRIATLTKRMREAERREKAALDYAKGVEQKRQTAETKFSKVNEDYVKQFETRVNWFRFCSKRVSNSN